MPPPPGYLAGVRELCDRHGIVYIADEVMCRVRAHRARGSPSSTASVAPDLIAFAKGVNSGYVPLGGVVISEPDRRHLRTTRVYPGGLTYSGHPLACAAAVAHDAAPMHEERIVENAAEIGRRCSGRDSSARRSAPIDRRGARTRRLLRARARRRPGDAKNRPPLTAGRQPGDGGARRGVQSSAG